MLELDIETRSACDLTKCGVYVYAEHPTTQVTHVAWRVGPAMPVEVWLPLMPDGWAHTGETITGKPVRMYGGPMPFGLWEALYATECPIVAHNASFERIVLSGHAGQAIGFPVLPIERMVCTAARAAAMGLPRTLDGATAALGVANTKDKVGHALMMKMCKPVKATGAWYGTPADFIREAEYCAHDVYGEIDLLNAIPDLSPTERQVWELTERMNDQGIRVDGPLADAVAAMVDDAMAKMNARLVSATGGMVPKVSDHMAITRWLRTVDADDTGLGEDGVGKAALAAMLDRADLDPLVREVLIIRRDGGKSSAAKYRAIAMRMSADGKIRGVLVYCGAGSTGRYASRGAQLHNLPRANLLRKASAVESLIRDLQDGAPLQAITDLHGPPLVLASELLRPVFIADDGYWMARADSAQIEARTLPWLAGAEAMLDVFRAYDAGTGPDVYKVAAAGIFQTTPDQISSEDPRRQTGKVSTLALGFQGGAGALQAMCRGYGVKIPRATRPDGAGWDWEAPAGTDEWIKQRWRASNPDIADRDLGLWAAMEKAAIDCMESAPGNVFHVGQLGVRFRRNSRALVMRLPSGRGLHYWSPRLRTKRMPWGKDKLTLTYRSLDSQTKQWAVFDGYGGIWAQNGTQAHARDLMAYWLLEMVRAGLTPLLTVHDEGIGLADKRRWPRAEDAAAVIESVFRQVPDFSAGLPVSCEASAGPRYMKG